MFMCAGPERQSALDIGEIRLITNTAHYLPLYWQTSIDTDDIYCYSDDSKRAQQLCLCVSVKLA